MKGRTFHWFFPLQRTWQLTANWVRLRKTESFHGCQVSKTCHSLRIDDMKRRWSKEKWNENGNGFLVDAVITSVYSIAAGNLCSLFFRLFSHGFDLISHAMCLVFYFWFWFPMKCISEKEISKHIQQQRRLTPIQRSGQKLFWRFTNLHIMETFGQSRFCIPSTRIHQKITK